MLVRAATIAVMLAGFFGWTWSARAAELAVGSWFEQETATGDWGGLRSRAEAAGVSFGANYETDLLANPIGGEQQGSAYAGLLEASLDFDLEKIAGLSGSSFFIAAYWASGEDLSDKRIGNAIDVSQVFDGRTVRLGQMYFEQKLFNDGLNVVIGRLSAGSDFATSELYENYVSSGVNDNPFTLEANLPSFTSDSIAAWGIRATVQATEQLYVAAGVYNADPDVGKDGEHGVDFVLNPEDGVLVMSETGYGWNQAKGDTGLPGNATFGGYYDSSDFEKLDNADAERDGNYGFYLLLDQMVYRDGEPGSDRGLTPWLAFTYAPREQVNTFPFSASGGLVYKGLFPERDEDRTALGVYYGAFSDKLEDQTFETVVEINHRFKLAPWLYVTPDFQYVIRPGGSDDVDDAAVFGGEIGIEF